MESRPFRLVRQVYIPNRQRIWHRHLQLHFAPASIALVARLEQSKRFERQDSRTAGISSSLITPWACVMLCSRSYNSAVGDMPSTLPRTAGKPPPPRSARLLQKNRAWTCRQRKICSALTGGWAYPQLCCSDRNKFVLPGARWRLISAPTVHKTTVPFLRGVKGALLFGGVSLKDSETYLTTSIGFATLISFRCR